MTQGPASALLEQELAGEIRRQGIVVWLDRDGAFTGFAEKLAKRHAEGAFPYPVIGFRGSHLELIFALEAHGSGYEKSPLLVHMPGFNEEMIRDTPVLELYLAGTRFRKLLDTLVQQAATGRASPEQVAGLLAQKPTLEQADAWLERASAQVGTGLAAMLESAGRTLLLEALTTPDSALARQVKTKDDVRALEEYLLKLTGMNDAWLSGMEGGDGLGRVLASAGAWILCVEYVHDLTREPHLDALKPLKKLPSALVKVCQQLAVDLRKGYGDAYAKLAGEVETAISGELDQMTAEDLGQIDTFAEEEERVLAGAVAALAAKDWPKAQTWFKAREGDKSFWTKREQMRRLAWDLVGEAAAFGLSMAQNPRPFAGVNSHDEAATRYAEVAHKIDRAHRQFEQERARCLDHRVPQSGALGEVVALLRELYRQWADNLARDFTRVCQACGFLPESELRQRNLYEQVVHPLTLGGEKVAVFLIDAFRYEMAVGLYEELRASGAQSTAVKLTPRLAELPTITAVGMNVLAPVVKDERLNVVGKFEGFRAGEFTVRDPEGRSRAIGMRATGQAALHIKLADLCDDTQKVLAKVKNHRVVVVHSCELDSAGEANVGVEVFEPILRRLRAAWYHLQGVGIKQAVFTADHGFLIQDGTSKPKPFGKKTDPQRRYVLDAYERPDQGVVPVPLAALGYDGITGYLLFREDTADFETKDKGGTFAHGGNSPQERFIPVLTVARKESEGAFVSQYRVATRAGEVGSTFHRLQVKLTFPPNCENTLPFVGPRSVDLGLRVPGRPDIRVSIREVSGDGRLAQGRIQANVKDWIDVSFSLEGKADERVPVEVYHPDNIHKVEPALAEGLFSVAGQTKAAAPTPAAAWMDNIADEGARAVFVHLAEHGSITEEEIVRKLGNARAFRRFSLGFDGYLKFLPWKARIESNASGKRYVREEDK